MALVSETVLLTKPLGLGVYELRSLPPVYTIIAYNPVLQTLI